MPDVEYLANYRANTLYVNPGQAGAYASIAGADERVLGEIQVTSRSRIAVSAFFVRSGERFDTFKITKLKWHKTYGWQEDGSVQINGFQAAHMQAFVSLISALNLSDAAKCRISLGDANLETVFNFSSPEALASIAKAISTSSALQDDIFALSAKRKAIDEFRRLLAEEPNEVIWQAFFERNPWIFGHGLNYVFLDKVASKLEATTTGASFDRSGKRVDALMRTRAEVSQYVLIEKIGRAHV